MTALLLAAALQVPFVAQQKNTCGPASLAMVLSYWGDAAGHDEVAAALGEPELKGVRGSRLAEFARGRGFEAIAYAGDLAQLRESLEKGRPLIVALGKGRGRFHNVVVTGFDAEHDRVLVNDPDAGPGREVASTEFEKRWAEAGHWTLLVVPARR